MVLATMGGRRNSLPATRPAESRGAVADGDRGDGGRSRSEQKSMWTTIDRLYDPWHSAMDVQTMAEMHRSGFAIRLAPVLAGAEGDRPSQAGDKKYNYDDAMMIVMSLSESISFMLQLEAYMTGKLTEVTVERGNSRGIGKRILLTKPEEFYGPDDEGFDLHKGSLVLTIEQDASDKEAARSVIFFSRPKPLILEDDGLPLEIFIEFETLRSALQSYIGNCARLDFGSIRLLGGSPGEERRGGVSAAMPVRRSGLAGASVSQPSSDAPAIRGIGAPRPSSPVRDTDIETALGGSPPEASEKDLEAALGAENMRKF